MLQSFLLPEWIVLSQYQEGIADVYQLPVTSESSETPN